MVVFLFCVVDIDILPKNWLLGNSIENLAGESGSAMVCHFAFLLRMGFACFVDFPRTTLTTFCSTDPWVFLEGVVKVFEQRAWEHELPCFSLS